MNIINFNEVSKQYKTKKGYTNAVQNISFNIEKGSIVGLIGPNGAGKSTIVKMLCGILKPTTGSVDVIGRTPWKDRSYLCKDIGVMFGNRSSLWYNLPAIESVYLMKDIYEIKTDVFKKRLNQYSNLLNIDDILNKPIRQMSLGQRIKIELLVSIIHNPKLLILDEPTLGLDIVAKKQFREILTTLADINKTTIVLTTHDLSDVEKVCKKIILINKGKKLVDSNKNDFTDLVSSYSVVYIENTDQRLEYLLHKKFLREHTPEWYKFFINKEFIHEFIEELLSNKDIEVKFKIEKPSLEDIIYEYYS